MPKTKDKFDTVVDAGTKGTDKTWPTTVTVVRKGSKRGEQFSKRAAELSGENADQFSAGVRRKVGRGLSADFLTDSIKRDERSKYAKK